MKNSRVGVVNASGITTWPFSTLLLRRRDLYFGSRNKSASASQLVICIRQYHADIKTLTKRDATLRAT